MMVSLVLASLLLPATVSGATPPDTSALRFYGLRAGAHLEEIHALLRRHGGRLHCDRAKRDPKVSECRGTISDSTTGPIKVWVSAMDSAAGVITLSATVDSGVMNRWRRDLERRYGKVAVRTQGGQSMLQWVRRGRMLRLTWRTERGALTASVSLVDGRVLDAWGAGRASGSS
jgi:hypothetical protein